jgi:large repetitive protein
MEMHYYLMPNGETHVSNDRDISVPQALRPVISGVPTLNDFFKKGHHTPPAKLSKLKPGPKYTDGSGNNFVGPADFATIYNTAPLLANGINGTGVTIGIAARSDIFLSDVQTYRQMFNLPVNDPNFINTGDDAGVVIGDDSETDLDTEISGGVAPNATVDVVIGTNNWLVDGITLSEMYLVESNIADIISISYSTCESSEGAGGNSFNNQLFEQAAAQGISVFVAAGDSGSAECDGDQPFETGGYATNGESSTWYSVAVGGTEFNETGGSYWTTNNGTTKQSATSYIPELPWNEAGGSDEDLPTTPDSPRRNRTVYTLRSGTGCRTIAWRVCGLAQAVRARTTCNHRGRQDRAYRIPTPPFRAATGLTSTLPIPTPTAPPVPGTRLFRL